MKSYFGIAIFLVLCCLNVTGCKSNHNKSAPKTLTRTFPIKGISKIVLRASEAESTTVKVHNSNTIEISATPIGDAKGYHSPDPNWKETPPEKWGLDFVAKQYDETLVISSKKEVLYIHHYYALSNIKIAVPKNVTVIKEKRQLDGTGAVEPKEGEADLSPPQQK